MMIALAACLALGDSIAVGTGRAMRCRLEARVGAPTLRIATWSPPASPTTIISTGSNDPRSRYLGHDMAVIRSKVRSIRVVWILPRDRAAARTAADVCAVFGDRAVDLALIPSRDGVHPVSYSRLSRMIRTARPC